MVKRALSLLAAGCLAAAPLRAETAGSEAAAEAPAAAAPAVLEYRAPSRPSAFREHAPLALFSLGSLAVGGIFYGIQENLDYPGRTQVSGDGSRIGMALGAAGLTALASGAAYLWYSLRAERASASSWSGTVAAGPRPEGGVAATVTVPLSAFVE